MYHHSDFQGGGKSWNSSSDFLSAFDHSLIIYVGNIFVIEEDGTIDQLERSVLGSVILSLQQEKQILEVQNSIPFSEFSNRARLIFSSIKEVRSRGIDCDLVLLRSDLELKGFLEKAGGIGYIAGLADVPQIESAKEYAAQLYRYIAKKKSLRILKEIHESIINGEPLNGKLENLKEFQDISHKKEAILDWDLMTGRKKVSFEKLTDLIDLEMEYVIWPICPKGTLTLVQGMPKSGKSTFCLWLSLCASIGVWPSGIFKIEKPRNVFLIEFEDAPLLVAKRAASYLKGVGMPDRMFPPNLTICDFPILPLDQQSFRDLLIQEIKKNKYGLIVIDTLAFVHKAGDESSSMEMKPVMSSLKFIARETETSIIVIHHSNKGSIDKPVAERARGSSIISGSADVIFDWGDRRKTNITPVEIRSKYDDSMKIDVYYKPQKDGGVKWELVEGETDDIDERKNITLYALKELMVSSPEGISGSTIVKCLPKFSERAIYKYLQILEKDGKVSISQGKGPEKKYKPIELETHISTFKS